MLTRNPDLTGLRIRSDKLASSGFVEAEIEEYIRLHEYYIGPISFIDWGGVAFDYFYNSPSDFADINDLSLVSFAFYGDFGIVFPGDLSKVGWEELLYRHPRAQSFREALARVQVFVASHHGRIDGYLEDVFKFCSPAVVVFSDKGLEHDTQETQMLYKKHAAGIPFTLASGKVETRYVFTTRNDGPMTITTTGQGFYLQTG
jgi:beta-lactamase superfamily II metal-dependent hydrolase